MSTEEDVKRVAKAICYANCLSEHPTDIDRARSQSENGWDLWILEARAAIVAMQSADQGIPIHPTELASPGIKGVATKPDATGVFDGD